MLSCCATKKKTDLFIKLLRIKKFQVKNNESILEKNAKNIGILNEIKIYFALKRTILRNCNKH